MSIPMYVFVYTNVPEDSTIHVDPTPHLHLSTCKAAALKYLESTLDVDDALDTTAAETLGELNTLWEEKVGEFEDEMDEVFERMFEGSDISLTQSSERAVITACQLQVGRSLRYDRIWDKTLEPQLEGQLESAMERARTQISVLEDPQWENIQRVDDEDTSQPVYRLRDVDWEMFECSDIFIHKINMPEAL